MVEFRRVWLRCYVAVLALGPIEAAAQSLEDALALSYWNNPTLKAERSALAAVDHGVTEALSAWRPTVAVNLGRSRSYLKVHDSFDNRATAILPSRQAGVTLSQRLADFGQTSGAVRAAEARVLAGRASLANVEQVVLLEAAEAYLGVVWAERVLDLNRANVQVLSRQLDAAEAGFARQMATMTDVAQARARHANARATLRRAEEGLDTARGRYLAVVGEAPASLNFPEGLPDLPDSRDAVLGEAETANLRVRAAGFAVEESRAAIDSAEATILPTVAFEASDSFETNSSVGISDQRVQRGGVIVRVPLYQSGAEYARIQARKQELGQRRQQLEAARRAARQQAQEAWNSLAAAQAQVDSYGSSVRANQIARDGVAAEHLRLGTRTLLDMLNAEQELFEARINLIGARRDQMNAAYRGVAAMGRMTAEALNLAVVRYDPAEHYQQVRGTWAGWGSDEVSAGEAGPESR
ncbi:MAG: TolC family outer membrane protein [Rhodospirillaceae bacterium]|nr:TolC family outer membrane protein [Rhodospirillales bacterium]